MHNPILLELANPSRRIVSYETLWSDEIRILSGSSGYDYIESDGYDEYVADWINLKEILLHSSKVDLSNVNLVVIDDGLSARVVDYYRDELKVIKQIYQLEIEGNDYKVINYTSLDYIDIYDHGCKVVSEIAELCYPYTPNIIFMGIMMEGYTKDKLYQLYEGLKYIWDNRYKIKPDVITMSIGFGDIEEYDDPDVITTKRNIDNLLYDLYNYGVVILAAAGNAGGSELYYPASSEYVISVGAIYDDKPDYEQYKGYRVGAVEDPNITWGSNYNESLDAVAPGVAVEAKDEYLNPVIFSGTSAATPLAAIVASYVVATYKRISAKYSSLPSPRSLGGDFVEFVRKVLHVSSENGGGDVHRAVKPVVNSPIIYGIREIGVGYGSVDAYDAVNFAGFISIRKYIKSISGTSVNIRINVTLAINNFTGVSINNIIRANDRYYLTYELYFVDELGRVWFIESGRLERVKTGNGFDIWRYSASLSGGSYILKVYAVGEYIDAGYYLVRSISIHFTTQDFPYPPY